MSVGGVPPSYEALSLYVVQVCLDICMKTTQMYAHLSEHTLSEAAELAGAVLDRMVGSKNNSAGPDSSATPEAAE